LTQLVENKITALIITRNEERNIERCLASLVQVADEIIVLDSFSLDNTKALSLPFNVRFIEHEWLGYAASKNLGSSHASNDFILSVDADEVLDAEAIEHIQLAKKGGLSGVYQLKRKNFIGKSWVRHGGWYPDWKLRLYDRRLAVWKGNYVHEELALSNQDVKNLKGNLLHYTVQDLSEQSRTVHKYAKLAAQRHLSQGKAMHPVRALLRTLAAFVKIYLLKLGFLDGLLGLQVALISAQSKWLRYTYFKSLKSK
jgi:glycosyltransferase involved in cell wall biosynthesis